MFDETTVINTLQRELQDVLDIVYYAPPSAEEKELAQHAGSLPGFQGLKMMPWLGDGTTGSTCHVYILSEKQEQLHTYILSRDMNLCTPVDLAKCVVSFYILM